ncbi:hypothetical protein HY479_03155 [Candidatus Uhrbacteria bacterium]|nr:hypothetical protein [Candidatus Uhrbacteria bacterium]
MLQPLRSSVSVVSLVVANAVPLFGVLYGGWDLYTIFMLYWVESAVIGFYNILKFTKFKGGLKFFLIPFFLLHYGAFMAAHLVFLTAFFAPGAGSFESFPLKPILAALWETAPAIVGLFVSHGVSFATNFIGKQEYLRVTEQQVMEAPYSRIVIMQVSIIFGGLLFQVFGLPVYALGLLIVLKTGVDVVAHLRQHAKVQARPPILSSTPRASKT